jgi:hypothetical protein
MYELGEVVSPLSLPAAAKVLDKSGDALNALGKFKSTQASIVAEGSGNATLQVPISHQSTAYNVDARAKEIASGLHADRQGRITVGVGIDENGVKTVTTNEPKVRLEVKKLLEEDEIPVDGVGHAEVTQPSSIVEVGSSRPVCIECDLEMRKRDVNIKSELSDDFARNRKQQLSPEQQQEIRDEVEKLRN